MSSAINRVCVLVLLSGLFAATPVRAQSPAASAAAPGERQMPSFASLFTTLPSDIRHLPSLTNAIVIGAAGGLALAVHDGDRNVTQEAQDSLALEEFLDPGEPIGNGIVQAGGALATYLIGRAAHRADVAILGADLVRAQIITAGVTQGIKFAVNRERPNGGNFSFPSGHSASSFATATVLQRHFGWKVGAPAYAIASYVAGSRLSENQHFLSDVIFGAGIGIVAGRSVTVGRGTHAFAVTPTAAHGGFGVSFTKIASR